MKEIEPESGLEQPAPVGLEELYQSNLIIISLLSRLYDIQMAVLTSTDRSLAEEIYESHAQGGNFNPPIYIPDFKDEQS